MKSTKTNESFTTTPASATIPISDSTVKFWPIIICPIIAPVKPNGIAPITISG